jgi:hypothetical protein
VSQKSTNPEPDPFENRVRFGCGFVFGAMISALLIGRMVASFTGTFWALVVAIAVITGLLARRYGDDFWHAIMDLFPWW